HFLVGDNPEGSGQATDINALGHVAGTTFFLRDDSETPGEFRFRNRAFVYDGTALTELGVLLGNTMSRAEGINRGGDVVGSSYGGPGEQHAFLHRDGELVDLGWGRALAVNDHREVVGGTVVVDVTKAFVYSNGELQVLGTLGGETSIAVDLNARGEIVGNSQTASGVTRAFLYRKGAMAELPVPSETSTAAAINRVGEIVGAASSGATPTVSEGYLYRNGQVSLLRDLVPDDGCWNRLEARDINDHGDIVGIGVMNSYASCGEPGRYLVVITRRPGRYR
ncbi:MAG TPA: hypothetical protein VGK73_13765, partial [Polyangiaceae bacterium]